MQLDVGPWRRRGQAALGVLVSLLDHHQRSLKRRGTIHRHIRPSVDDNEVKPNRYRPLPSDVELDHNLSRGSAGTGHRDNV